MSQNLPTQVEFGGEITLQAEEGQTPRFEIQAYNGGPLPVKGHRFPVVVELASASFERSVTKINRNHEQKRELGHTDQQTISATGIFLAGPLSVPGKDRDEVVQAAKDEFPWDASIEAAFPTPELVKAGQKVHINGRVQSGPFLIARKAIITGTAILNRGADRTTEVRIAAEEKNQMDAESVKQEVMRLKKSGMTMAEMSLAADLDEKMLAAIVEGKEKMPEGLMAKLKGMKAKSISAKSMKAGKKMKAELKSYIEAEGFDPDGMNENQIQFFEAQFAESGNTMNKLEELEAAAVERAAERVERLAEYSAICAEYGNPTIEVDGEQVSLEAHAIRNNLEPREVRLEARLYDVERRGGGSSTAPFSVQSNTSPGTNLTDKEHEETLCAALAMNHFGISEESAGETYSEKAMHEASGRKFRQQSLHSVMGTICAAAGMPYYGQHKSMDFWQHTVEAQEKLEASGTSTLSIKNIFENVLNKAQLDSFNHAPSMWREIAYIESSSDFKPISRVRLTADGGYREVAKDGEIKHISVTDTKRTNQAKTFGAMMTLTRQDIINDDLSALTSIAQHLGHLAGITIEELVWTVLLSNDGGFFSTANNNLANVELGHDELSTVRNMFLNRIDSNNKAINIGPAMLIHGVPLLDVAEDLYAEKHWGIGNTTGSDGNLISKRNRHYNMYTPVKSPFLSNTLIRDRNGDPIPNQSDSLWFLMSRATAMLHALSVVFLNGNQTPTTSTSDMEFNKLGVQYRSYHDFGVAYGDPEAVVMSQPPIVP